MRTNFSLSIALATLVIVFFVGPVAARGQASVDHTFNVSVSTTTFGSKSVNHLIQLPDGKILVGGQFNNYNGHPVGGFVRLNPDFTLDQTFNNSLFPHQSSITKILLTGTDDVYLRVYPVDFLRVKPGGTIDPTFDSNITGPVYGEAVDPQGRLILSGYIVVNRNGTTVTENVVRLNPDGTVDLSFDAPPIPNVNGKLALHGDKIFVTGQAEQQNIFFRLGPTGTAEIAALPIGPNELKELISQADGMILVKTANQLRRIDGNGVTDPTFNVFSYAPSNNPRFVYLGADGQITIGSTVSGGAGVRILRLRPDGTEDPTYTPYHHPSGLLDGTALLSDDSLLIGDSSYGTVTNAFKRLLPNGPVDPNFNPGGTGFLSYLEGRIRAILPLQDGKLLIGGDFQRVNGVAVNRMARINADGTLDPSFGLTVGTSGNAFSKIEDIYGFTAQPDGKILITGAVWYRVNSVEKAKIVRVLPNGDIDTSFNLGVPLIDYFGGSGLGKDKMLIDQNGKILVGSTAGSSDQMSLVPVRLNPDGSRDTSFVSTLFAGYGTASVFDLSHVNAGKSLISGRKHELGMAGGSYAFLYRINSDGSADPAFSAYEDLNRTIVAFKVLTSGKIVAILRGFNNTSQVLRFEADGTLDTSFQTGIGANGNIQAVEALDDGTIFVGGSFSLYNGQPRRNIATLNSDGTLRSDPLSSNGEVLCFARDSQDRILIGGSFTSINGATQSFARTYLARLVSDGAGTTRTLFDYDGDGRSDLSVRRPSDNRWYLLRGTAGYTVMEYGIAGDKMAPADYDGDGKTDVAVFRPSEGKWYIYMSATQAFQTYNWGQEGDLPVPTDRDADGSTDLVIFRPSNNTWYTRYANGTFNVFEFGVAGDKPVRGDFDGDGRGDIALYRPSNNNWYIIKSSIGFFIQTWGEAGDIPVTGDFDGDGATDQAVFRPSTGQWFLSQTTQGFSVRNWGEATDIPIPADYDGDGKMDVAIFRPSNSTWYIVNSTDGIQVQPYGEAGDVPTQSAFIYSRADNLRSLGPPV